MLQALRLDTATAPTKSRRAEEISAEAADMAFAGMMAQASLAAAGTVPRAAEPAPEPPAASPRVEARERNNPPPASRPQRAEPEATERTLPKERQAAENASASTEKTERPEATEPETATPPETDSNQAKASTAETPSDPETAEAAAKAPAPALNPGLSGLPGVAAPASTPVPNPQGLGLKTDPSATDPTQGVSETEGVAETGLAGQEVAAPVAKDGKSASTQTPAPVKSPFQELLYLPKAEIQTPKFRPETIKPSNPAAQVETPQEVKPGTDTTATPAQDLETALAGAHKPAIPNETAIQARLEVNVPQPLVVKSQTTLTDPTAPVQMMNAKTTSAVAATAATAARQVPVVTQVEGSIRWILQNKTRGAELQLNPESLGKVVISLRVEGQEVHARLWASEPASLTTLQDHKAFLEASLKEQGLSLGSFDLHSGARGNSPQTTDQERAQMASMRGLPRIEVKQEMPSTPVGSHVDVHQIEVYA